MSERFQRLFSLTPNLYSDDCPIIIEAGALQKDTESGALIVQLKMRNIGEKDIYSCRISLKAFATNGDEVEGVSDFSYLDLNSGRGREFGTKVPVILPDRTARSFVVDINEIVFVDGTVKKLSNNRWKPVPKQRSIEQALQDAELTKQYKIEVGGSADLFPEKTDGFFLCTCGAINLESADTCYKCGRSYENLIGCLDKENLSIKIDERHEREAIDKTKKDKMKKIILIAAACIAVIVIAISVFNSMAEKKKTETDAAIRSSLSGKSFTADMVSDSGHAYKQTIEFVNSDICSSMKESPLYDDAYYEVRQTTDGDYVMDINAFADSKASLFRNGDYDYIITKVEGTQITEFVHTFSSIGSDRVDYYYLDR